MKELIKLKVDTIKIPSGEITNVPLLEKIGKSGKRIILSTGMSKLKEILGAIKILTKHGTKEKIFQFCIATLLILLHLRI